MPTASKIVVDRLMIERVIQEYADSEKPWVAYFLPKENGLVLHIATSDEIAMTPGPVSDSSDGPGDETPYVPHWCYDPPGPAMCVCGDHEGYHNDVGECLRVKTCGCVGMSALTVRKRQALEQPR